MEVVWDKQCRLECHRQGSWLESQMMEVDRNLAEFSGATEK